MYTQRQIDSIETILAYLDARVDRHDDHAVTKMYVGSWIRTIYTTNNVCIGIWHGSAYEYFAFTQGRSVPFKELLSHLKHSFKEYPIMRADISTLCLRTRERIREAHII